MERRSGRVRGRRGRKEGREIEKRQEIYGVKEWMISGGKEG